MLKWYQRLCAELWSLGFHHTEADWGIFVARIGREILLLASHVDNCMVTGSSKVLRSLPISPLSLFAIPGDRTPNLTMILITTDHYTPYPKYRPWPRLSHSLMAICLMFTSCQILHHAYRTATHLSASCISSPLYDPYLALCSSYVFPLTLHDSPSSYRV